MPRKGILFSTKDKYDEPYWKVILWAIIPWVLVEGAILLFFDWEMALILGLVWVFFIGKELAKPLLMKKSYVELHETYLQGVSMRNLDGDAFRVRYTDIVRVDTATDCIILHTTDGTYKVQAYKCEEKVGNMIRGNL